MRQLIAWLRTLGPAGGFVADALALLTTNWVAVVSLLLGLVTALWASAVAFFQEPRVQTGIEVFLAALWTMVGALYLYDRTKPRIVRVALDYRYGLTFDGIMPAVDLLNDETWFSVAVQLRNSSQAPIRYAVTEFDVRIGSRALPKPERPMTSVLARGAAKTSSPSRFSKNEMREFFGKRMKGTADITVVYGHPEEKPVRKLTIKAELLLHFPLEGEHQQPFGWGADIISEVDDPI
jgi:hypothetical protein